MRESATLWIEPEEKDEFRLAIDLLPGASRPSRLWFFVHGLTSHRRGDKAQYLAQRVTEKGDAFASLDLTGHGESEGDLLGLCLSRNLKDLQRGLRFAEQEFGHFSAVNLVGSSMGGLTVLWYSALNPGRIRANIVIAPAFEMAGRLILSLGPQKARRWRQEGKVHLETDYAQFDLAYSFVEDESRYATTKLVQSLTTPTLILHGSADESVPCRLSSQFAARVEQVSFVEIEGGDHRLTDHKERLFREMWDWVGPPQWVF